MSIMWAIFNIRFEATSEKPFFFSLDLGFACIYPRFTASPIANMAMERLRFSAIPILNGSSGALLFS